MFCCIPLPISSHRQEPRYQQPPCIPGTVVLPLFRNYIQTRLPFPSVPRQVRRSVQAAPKQARLFLSSSSCFPLLPREGPGIGQLLPHCPQERPGTNSSHFKCGLFWVGCQLSCCSSFARVQSSSEAALASYLASASLGRGKAAAPCPAVSPASLPDSFLPELWVATVCTSCVESCPQA